MLDFILPYERLFLVVEGERMKVKDVIYTFFVYRDMLRKCV